MYAQPTEEEIKLRKQVENLEQALRMALNIIERYQMDIGNLELPHGAQTVGGLDEQHRLIIQNSSDGADEPPTLATIGFCQGSMYLEAIGFIKRIAAGLAGMLSHRDTLSKPEFLALSSSRFVNLSLRSLPGKLSWGLRGSAIGLRDIDTGKIVRATDISIRLDASGLVEATLTAFLSEIDIETKAYVIVKCHKCKEEQKQAEETTLPSSTPAQ